VFENGFAPYVQYATSFQPTYGAQFAEPGEVAKPFEPTTGEQVEGGIKWDGRNLAEGNRLFATLAVYKITQDKVLVPDPLHAFFQVQTGEVDVDGVELEIVGRFQERLSFNASYTRTNTDPELVMVPEQKSPGSSTTRSRTARSPGWVPVSASAISRIATTTRSQTNR
jgi:iron complex outermembrane receptor protein